MRDSDLSPVLPYTLYVVERPLMVLNTEFDDCRFNRYFSNSLNSIINNNRYLSAMEMLSNL